MLSNCNGKKTINIKFLLWGRPTGRTQKLHHFGNILFFKLDDSPKSIYFIFCILHTLCILCVHITWVSLGDLMRVLKMRLFTAPASGAVRDLNIPVSTFPSTSSDPTKFQGYWKMN